MASEHRTFLVNIFAIYFTLFFIVLGPIAGYIFALYKYQRYIDLSPPVQRVSANMVTNSNIVTEPKKNMVAPRVSDTERLLSAAIGAFSTSTLTEDGRIKVTREMLNGLFASQDANPTLFTDGWNSDAPNEWVSYANKDLGIISMKIPYNSSWGNTSFSLVPYEVDGGRGLLFGNLGVRLEKDVLHSWPISFVFEIRGKRELKPIKAGETFMYPEGLKIERINGHDVAYGKTWIDYAGMTPVSYEIAGSEHNYFLIQGVGSPTDERMLREIVEKIHVE